MATLTIDHWIAADQRVFRSKKKYIDGALLHGDTGIIDGVTDDHKEDIFYMLMFCLCVPQSKAIKAGEAIDRLKRKKFYTHDIPLDQITKELTGLVRFHPTKAKRLLEAKTLFLETNFWERLKSSYYDFLHESDKESVLQLTRKTLIRHVNGMGMKLASHFMRNIGMSGLAILDVHIIGGLRKRGVIDIDLLSPSVAEYIDIEQKMIEYAKIVGISLNELDLLLWSEKTGYVFK